MDKFLTAIKQDVPKTEPTGKDNWTNFYRNSLAHETVFRLFL